MSSYEKNMAFWSLGKHQDIISFLNTLTQRGYTISDIYDYIAWKSEQLNTEKERRNALKLASLIHQLCPECNAYMFLHSVNDKPGNQTGDLTDKTMWLCQNSNCMNTLYNKKTAQEIKAERGK